jgi:AcrR family transcriptional regulator
MSEPSAPNLSPALRQLWAGDGAPRDRRPALTVERIVAAAIGVADRHGLEAVTMARVAEALDVTTMALYRHVTSKDELVVLMVDAAAGPPPDLPLDAGWRTATEVWARALAEVSRGWILEVPISGPPLGPNAVAWMEAGLHALSGSGLPPLERLSIVTTLSGYVRQHAALVHAMNSQPANRTQRQVELEWRQTLADLIDPDRFPEVSQVLASGAFDPGRAEPDGDPDLDLGLTCILEGVVHLAENRPPGS